MSNRKYDIISAGLMVCDILAAPLDVSVFEKDTSYLDDIAFATGGDALNVAVGAAKLGLNVGIGGYVGDDMAGHFIADRAKAQGIDCTGLAFSHTKQTSTSIILREPHGERHFAFYGGANHEFDGDCISDELLDDTSMLYIGSTMALASLDGAPLARLFARAKDHGVITAMDATSSIDGIWLPKIEDALQHTDIFIPSLFEAEKLCGTTVPEKIVEFLKSRGVKVAGVKLGKQGVYIEGELIPAFECDNVIDTTGAGDSFMAGFCTAYLKGMSIRDCALVGSAASNFCIRYVGATTGIPGFDEANALANKYKAKLFG